ncbi:hypothetical protein [Streptomyces sp. NPDC051214]|uniref:hypothetical protein n=1 Tax=Streptomyces sp. NPDC051214 TaxID=3155282 RepID=UPI0034493BBA
MNRKIAAVTGAVIATVALSTTIGASPALAAGSVKKTAKAGSAPPSGVPCSVGKGVTACFEKQGDKMWVRDNQEDGHHAVGGFGFANGDSDVWDYECHDYKGKAGGWTYCSWASTIPESSTITFRGMEFNGSTPLFNGDAGPAQSSKAS